MSESLPVPSRDAADPQAHRQGPGLAGALAALPAGITPQSLASLNVDLERPATCSSCGCTDHRACPGGCYWLAVDRASRTGICIGCSDTLDSWLMQHGAQNRTAS